MSNLIDQNSLLKTNEPGRKGGFTLMELMVYIAILGVVVIIAGQAFSDSTKIRVRTQSQLKATEVAANMGTIFKDDVAQMGAKSAVDPTHSTSSQDAFFFDESAYIDLGAEDSSSFNISASKDTVTLRRIKYAETGAYERTEEIVWYLGDNQTLYRSCKTVTGTEDANVCPEDDALAVEMATGVTDFTVLPSKPGVLDGTTSTVFPYYPSDVTKKSFRVISYYGKDNFMRVISSPEEGGESVTLSNMVTNYKEAGEAASTTILKHMVLAAESGSAEEGWQNCKAISFKKDSTYEISFRMSNDGGDGRMFRPGIDHMAVGLRATGDFDPKTIADVPDFYFYPPEGDEGIGQRSMRFSIHNIPKAKGSTTEATSINACVAFTMAFYSPTVSMGSFVISNLKVSRIGDYDYVFDSTYDPEVADKKNVRAFRVNIEVKRNGNAGVSNFVVPVPSNGVRG